MVAPLTSASPGDESAWSQTTVRQFTTPTRVPLQKQPEIAADSISNIGLDREDQTSPITGIEPVLEEAADEGLPPVPDTPVTQTAPQGVSHTADALVEPKSVADERYLPPPTSTLPPYLVPPAIQPSEADAVQMITVILRSTGDKTRDVLRLRRIHGIITSYPGNDRFAFHVFERGRGYLLEFPNLTIGVCQELLGRLTSLIGADNIRVEKITFQ